MCTLQHTRTARERENIECRLCCGERRGEKAEENQKSDSENLQNMMVKNESSRDSDLGFIFVLQKARIERNTSRRVICAAGEEKENY